MTPSSLRALVTVDYPFTKLRMPAPRSNLISLGKCAKVFKGVKTTLLQSQCREIASSFRSPQTFKQLSLITNQTPETFLAMTNVVDMGVMGAVQ